MTPGWDKRLVFTPGLVRLGYLELDLDLSDNSYQLLSTSYIPLGTMIT